MDLEPSATRPQNEDKVFFASRIPKTSSEDQLQKIFSHHFDRCLISLNVPRKKSKSNFITAIVTIPDRVVSENALLLKALKSPRGVQIPILPLTGIYFRPYLTEKKTPESFEIDQLKKALEQIEQKYERKIQELTESLDKAEQIIYHNRYSVESNAHRITDLEESFREFKDRKRHSDPSPPHKRHK